MSKPEQNHSSSRRGNPPASTSHRVWQGLVGAHPELWGWQTAHTGGQRQHNRHVQLPLLQLTASSTSSTPETPTLQYSRWLLLVAAATALLLRPLLVLLLLLLLGGFNALG
jgi:hypothetical protein